MGKINSNIDRLVKFVWLGTGALILLLLLIGIGSFVGDWLFNSSSSEPTGVAVNNKKKEGLEKVKLALSYEAVNKIGNSDFYVLPVHISYEESTSSKIAGYDSYSRIDNVHLPSNLIFLNQKFEVIRTLLDKKALIIELNYPQDVTKTYDGEAQQAGMNFILYQIAFADTDADGQIDTDDQSDLFISDLDGGNLTPITKGWNIVRFDFYDDYKTLLITYTEVADKNTKPKKHLATYTIATKELKKMTPVEDELKKIEKILVQ